MGSAKTPSSVKRAERREQERQAQIKRTTGRIDEIFDAPERQAQYGDFLANLRGLYSDELNDQKSTADRSLKFSMARSGLTGGSAALDAGKRSRDEYQRGVLTAERKAQQGVADLQAADQQARLNMISLAQSGVDSTTAARRASEALRSNLTGARSSADVGALGDVFASTAGTYQKQQEAAERRRGYSTPVGSVYGNPWGA